MNKAKCNKKNVEKLELQELPEQQELATDLTTGTSHTRGSIQTIRTISQSKSVLYTLTLGQELPLIEARTTGKAQPIGEPTTTTTITIFNNDYCFYGYASLHSATAATKCITYMLR